MQGLIGKNRKNNGTEPVITIERHPKKRVVLLFLSSLKAFTIQIQCNADFHAVIMQLYLTMRPIYSELRQPRTEQCDFTGLRDHSGRTTRKAEFTFTMRRSTNITSIMLQFIHTE